jgi:hypothetical protein
VGIATSCCIYLQCIIDLLSLILAAADYIKYDDDNGNNNNNNSSIQFTFLFINVLISIESGQLQSQRDTNNNSCDTA